MGGGIQVGRPPLVVGGVDVPGGQAVVGLDGDAVVLLTAGAAEVEGEGDALAFITGRTGWTGQFAPVVEVWAFAGQTGGDGAPLGEEGVQLGNQARLP